MGKMSVKKIIGASVLAIAAGLMQPMLAPMVMAVCAAPVLIAVFYAWAGWIPAALMAAFTTLSVAGTSGLMWNMDPALAGAAVLIVLALPGLAAAWMLNRRMPFFRRMTAAVLIQSAALIGLTAAVYMGMGVDLVNALTGWLRAAAENMPSDMLSVIVNNFAVNGMLTEESIEELTSGIVLRADIMQVLDQAFEYMNYQMRLTMPAMLFNSGLISGVLMTTMPGLICARRGEGAEIDYRPISEWHMPPRMVGGVVTCMLTGIVLQLMQIEGAVSVTAVFSTVGATLFVMQGIGCLSRRFKATGARRGYRIAMIVLGVVFAYGFMEIVGIMSALFGRKGAISLWMRRRMEENRKDDDE